MFHWHLILIAITLMKTKDCSVISGEISRYDLSRYFDETIDIEKRLPEDVVPQKYVIVISPDFKKDEFYGSIRIDIELRKARDYIVLHAKDLTVSSTKLYTQKTHTEVRIGSTYPVEKREMLVVKLYKSVPSGKYFLEMNFTGNLKGKITGFYLSTYTDVNQSIRKLAVTQFESTHARSAFPCFDEPNFKSVFDIRIVHQKRSLYQPLSNMPIMKVETSVNDSNNAITFFDPTPLMSTYLIAFVISDFECLGSNLYLLNGSKIALSVCMRPMYRTKTKFALNVATEAMKYYLNILQIDYPLPKLDLVAIPDFAAGAMENWGLITFRETELALNVYNSSCFSTKSVSLTIAHELAHMWFGDLVTMNWWNDLWLNEGFATYMEYLAVDSIFPEWHLVYESPRCTVLKRIQDMRC